MPRLRRFLVRLYENYYRNILTKALFRKKCSKITLRNFRLWYIIFILLYNKYYKIIHIFILPRLRRF